MQAGSGRSCGRDASLFACGLWLAETGHGETGLGTPSQVHAPRRKRLPPNSYRICAMFPPVTNAAVSTRTRPDSPPSSVSDAAFRVQQGITRCTRCRSP
ncbi:hypothetical protein PsYK624_014450 [Phanerochaete sordida]|uniref:Uncharacterized protein n=1 Tax=Phanerochaete sordida TaxID=48140 RepID=A0A9P3FZD1_9APHY|nr:hypothetical protein PsYK624_014450 [Phanerochaete sordida]